MFWVLWIKLKSFPLSLTSLLMSHSFPWQMIYYFPLGSCLLVMEALYAWGVLLELLTPKSSEGSMQLLALLTVLSHHQQSVHQSIQPAAYLAQGYCKSPLKKKNTSTLISNENFPACESLVHLLSQLSQNWNTEIPLTKINLLPNTDDLNF